MRKMIEVLPKEVSETFNIHVKYILFQCDNLDCGHTWGVNLADNKLRDDQLLCQKCGLRKLGQDV